MPFDDIRAELKRVEADDVELHSDERRSRLASPLVKITIGSRSCTVEVTGLLKMLSCLADGVGNDGIEAALEMQSCRAEAWVVA
jgi:hypothetical protein